MTQKMTLKFVLIFAFISGAFVAQEKEWHDPKKLIISFAGTQLIATFEGFRDSIYTCPGGKPTIGFGHVVKEAEKEKFSQKITKDEGLKLLTGDVVATYVPDIHRLVTVSLTQEKFDALTSFDYNLGAKNLGSSTLLKLLNEKKYEEASWQFPLWRNAGGKYLPGLLKRRLAEMYVFRGSDQVPLEGLKLIPTKNAGETLADVYQALRDDLKKEAVSLYTAYRSNRGY